MGITPEKTRSKATKESGQHNLSKILHRGLFSCAAVVGTFLVLALAMPRRAAAQEDQPQIMPGERRPAKKKDTGPRALAILRLGADGKTSLVPVTILINGKFWDASSYKADPVPMALEPGTVYEAERTGNSLGLFTVGSALHSNAANAQVPWLGTGMWRPTDTEAKVAEVKTDTAPKGIEDADAAPRLTRDPSRVHEAPASPAPASGGTAPSSTPSSSDKPKSSDGDEPPRLTKGSSPPASEPPASSPPAGQTPSAPSSTPTPTPSSGSGDSKSSKPGANKPDGSKPDADKKADAKADDKANIPTSDSGTNGANRPRLRRGKPAESFADEDVPGYSKPGAKLDTNAGKIVATVAATQSDVQLIPAISDASRSQLRPFTFDWLKGEEDDRRKQMVALAKEQLQAYIAAKKKTSTTTAKPAHAAPVHHVAVPEPILETVQMAAYDLWKSNQPVMILSATAHMPAAPAGNGHSEYDSELQYSVVIVAYPDIYNNLHKLYTSVTDKFHLDMTPRLELIDVVDVDGDGYGELLFRETTDQGTGWVIYRATADKLWKMFDSLSPEG
jgi:hypothetical protein